MTTELMTETGVGQTGVDESAMKEYGVVIDGVIEMAKGLDEKFFFDGLLDVMIEYVEKQGAFAGLSMSHRGYVDDDTGVTDDKEAA